VDYSPKFSVSNEIIKYLARIDAAKAIVDELSVPLTFQNEFRIEAKARMSHYSTKIEGNRLTLKQTKELLAGKEVIARDIDKREVMNYYDCSNGSSKPRSPGNPSPRKISKICMP